MPIMTNLLQSLSHGFFLSLAMIMAIGAQNAFVLKQGIRGKRVMLVALVCAVCDAFLIVIGAMGVGAFIAQTKMLQLGTCILGAGFLGFYAFNSFRTALRKRASIAFDESGLASNLSIAKVIFVTMAFSLLNPHAWLDTVVVIGSVSGQYNDPMEHAAFTVGACLVSFVWFFALGYVAKKLRHLFSSPQFLRGLDCFIGVLMTAIALSLVRHAWGMW